MNDTTNSGGPPRDDELERLRALILGDEALRLRRLDQRVSDPQHRTGDVAEVLPGAMNRAIDNPVARPDLERPIVETIRSAIKRDTQGFAEALFPVLGPAIRRAVADALKSLVQRINAALEHSFTAKGMRWRLEAMRTGVPFGQVVLRETMLYAVQEVFLIQPRTGLVLASARRADTVVLDKDAFSGMLTAIQAFIKDSFGAAEDERLRSAELGDRSLWAVSGPNAVLACMVLGSPPTEVRERLMEVLETLHARYGDEFDGRPEQLSDRPGVEAILQETLSAEHAEPKEKDSGRAALLWGAAGLLVVLLLGWLVWGAIQTNRLERDVVRLFESQPGYVVTGHAGRRGSVSLTGLRDPLAHSPEDVLAAADVDVDAVHPDFRPYQSLDQAIVLRRLQGALGSGGEIELLLDGQRLSVRGDLTPDQYDLLEALPATHPLIRQIDLPPRAQAPAEVREPLPPPAQELRPDPAAERERLIRQLDAALAALDGQELRFVQGRQLTPAAAAGLDRLAGALTDLFGLAAELDIPLQVNLEGFADGVGDAQRNREVALDRARAVRDELAARGIDGDRVALDPGHWESGRADPAMRKVVVHAAREPAS